MRKKILILTNSAEGLYLFRLELIEELLSQYQVIVCSPEENTDGFVKKIMDTGAEHRTTRMNRTGKNPFADLKLFFRYIDIIKKDKPKIILTYTIKPNIYGGTAASIYNIPYICNITGLGAGFSENNQLKKLLLFLYRIGLRKADTIFFQNNNGVAALSDIVKDTTYKKIIPGSGVNLERLQYQEYPIKEEIVFNFVGRIITIKGIEYFLDGVENIKKEFPNTIFNIIGDMENERYKARISRLHTEGIINYIGHTQNIKSYIVDSHAIIHCSFSEGLSNVILEHAAIGRPAIASDIPGCREIVDDEETGFLFEPGNTKKMEECIKKFILLDRKTKEFMGKKAREKVEQEFGRDIIVREYMERINRIMSRG